MQKWCEQKNKRIIQIKPGRKWKFDSRHDKHVNGVPKDGETNLHPGILAYEDPHRDVQNRANGLAVGPVRGHLFEDQSKCATHIRWWYR